MLDIDVSNHLLFVILIMANSVKCKSKNISDICINLNIINHIMYADDIVLISLSITGIKFIYNSILLTNILVDILFNSIALYYYLIIRKMVC